MADNIFLLGFMGSGKSTIGSLLAKRLGRRFIDSDVAIADRLGVSISETTSKRGESFFRQQEREFLESLEPRHSLVVACGGGMPCFQDNMNIINSLGVSVFLDASVDTLIGRLGENPTEERFLLKNLSGEDLKEFIQIRLAEREKFYHQSTFRVANNGAKEDCLAEILRLLEEK